jgi:hypothetical protein
MVRKNHSKSVRNTSQIDTIKIRTNKIDFRTIFIDLLYIEFNVS